MSVCKYEITARTGKQGIKAYKASQELTKPRRFTQCCEL